MLAISSSSLRGPKPRSLNGPEPSMQMISYSLERLSRHLFAASLIYSNSPLNPKALLRALLIKPLSG